MPRYTMILASADTDAGRAELFTDCTQVTAANSRAAIEAWMRAAEQDQILSRFAEAGRKCLRRRHALGAALTDVDQKELASLEIAAENDGDPLQAVLYAVATS